MTRSGGQKKNPKDTGSSDGVSSSKPSPHKGMASPPGRKPLNKVKRKVKLDHGWYLSSRSIAGGIIIYYMTLGNMVDDAFFQNMKNLFLVEQTEDHELLNMGFFGPVTLRVGLRDGRELTNAKNSYSRKVMLQLVEPANATNEARLEVLNCLKRFLEQKENNKFGTPVHILNPGWNLDSPDPNAPLPKLDNYVVYKDIVEVIQASFEGTDSGTWAADNMEAAMTYFTEGFVPYAAADDLGFPREMVNNPINLSIIHPHIENKFFILSGYNF